MSEKTRAREGERRIDTYAWAICGPLTFLLASSDNESYAGPFEKRNARLLLSDSSSSCSCSLSFSFSRATRGAHSMTRPFVRHYYSVCKRHFNLYVYYTVHFSPVDHVGRSDIVREIFGADSRAIKRGKYFSFDISLGCSYRIRVN